MKEKKRQNIKIAEVLWKKRKDKTLKLRRYYERKKRLNIKIAEVLWKKKNTKH